jgi:fumarate reductase subunit C
MLKLGQVTSQANRNMHPFIGDMTGKRNKDSTPYSVFMLYFATVITLLVETNRYYQQYLDFLDNGLAAVPDISEFEMFLLLAIIQMGHDICDNLKDHWSPTE